MGAQPKKKTSHAKKNSRRQHDALTLGSIVPCPHCRRPHLNHHVCPNCGYYHGREVVSEDVDRVEA